MEDERHFNFYDPQKRLPSQVDLLDRLEQNSYEVHNKRILTTEKIGIPVTAILLLLKESLDQIVNFQNELSTIGKNKTKKIINEADLTTTGIINKNIGNSIISNQWLQKEFWLADPNESPSGTGVVYVYESNQPLNSSPILSLNKYFTPGSQKVRILDNEIIRPADPLKRKTLFGVYKNIILFLEFSYALSERITNEVESYENYTAQSISKLPLPKEFNKSCSRRGDVIHNGEFKLEVEPNASRIIFGKNTDVQKSFELSYEEAVKYVNDIYGKMLKLLSQN